MGCCSISFQNKLRPGQPANTTATCLSKGFLASLMMPPPGPKLLYWFTMYSDSSCICHTGEVGNGWVLRSPLRCSQPASTECWWWVLLLLVPIQLSTILAVQLISTMATLTGCKEPLSASPSPSICFFPFLIFYGRPTDRPVTGQGPVGFRR